MHTLDGTIATKLLLPASSYVQQPPGASRGMRTPVTIPLAPSYRFEVRLARTHALVRVVLNEVEGARFSVGDPVSVTLERRRLLPFWAREFATGMRLRPALGSP